MAQTLRAGCRAAIAAVAAGLGVAQAQSVVHFSGMDAGTGSRPNARAAELAFESAAVLLGDRVLRVLDFESVALGTFMDLSPADTGVAGLSILGAGESRGTDTSITNQVFAAEGFNTTLGGSRYLKIEEDQPGAGVEPEVGITFEFAEPIAAFGTYITGADPLVEGSVSAVFDNGQLHFVLLDGIPGSGAQFWGFTDLSMAGISRVTIMVYPESGINTDAISIDDVRWVALPEPSSLALLLAAGLFLMRRRRGA